MTYTHKPRTVAEIKADIAETAIDIARAHDDDLLSDLQIDLDSLFDELAEAEAALPVPDKYAPTGGLDLVKVARAFGGIPKEWDDAP